MDEDCEDGMRIGPDETPKSKRERREGDINTVGVTYYL